MRKDTVRTVDQALDGALEGGREHAAQALQRVVTAIYRTVEQNTCVLARDRSDGGVGCDRECHFARRLFGRSNRYARFRKQVEEFKIVGTGIFNEVGLDTRASFCA